MIVIGSIDPPRRDACCRVASFCIGPSPHHTTVPAPHTISRRALLGLPTLIAMGNSFKKAHGLKGSASKGSKELAFKDKYTLGKELGSGAFSVVRLGTSKVPVAVRVGKRFVYHPPDPLLSM